MNINKFARTIALLLTAASVSAFGTAATANDSAALPPGIVSKDEPKTFLEGVAKINATPAFFKALAAQPDVGPVINLNLLR